MKNGIIYPLIAYIVENLNKLNLVEFFKFIATKVNSNKTNSEKERVYSRVAVDIFMVLKWFFILFILFNNNSNILLTIIVWYLIITNLYTYFYRHVWCDDAIDSTNMTKDRVRRRFVNLILAFFYSNICFAYLYYLPYVKNMSWGENLSTSKLHALWFSTSNSLAANYAVVTPFDGIGNSIALIQLIITFIFITIIISKSIPQTN